MNRRTLSFVLVGLSLALFTTGAVLALVGPTPGCDDADSRPKCEREAYQNLAFIILAVWTLGAVITIVGTGAYVTWMRAARAERQRSKQRLRMQAAPPKDARMNVAVRDTSPGAKPAGTRTTTASVDARQRR